MTGKPEPAYHTLTSEEPAFPTSLLAVRPQPHILYARGDLSVLLRPIVAIVGSRRPSLYGVRVAYRAAYEAARAGLVVVSGMARGLDARAHRGALEAGGQTIAVLGAGIDLCYPEENRDLFERVPKRGLLLTEFPPGSRPAKWTFPARNRLIAGLARCLLVVEGRAQGGTSNTVAWTLSLGRSVLAVPGHIDEPVASGPNGLLRDGAKPYLSPQDLLDEFGLQWQGEERRATEEGHEAPTRPFMPVPGPVPLDGAEATVFDLITPEPTHVDRIAQRAELEPGLLLAALSSLELKGLVTQLPGKHFALAS